MYFITLTFLAYFREEALKKKEFKEGRVGGPKIENSDHRSLSEKKWARNRVLHVTSL